MAFKIMPHGRLQEWVADEKGYFTAEGLEYSFVLDGDYGIHASERDAAGERRRQRELRLPLGHERRGQRGVRPARDDGLLGGAVRHRRAAGIAGAPAR
jgi:hypothetical protein